MPDFPGKEADIVALANVMTDGYTAHAVDFPSADFVRLKRALSKYNNDKNNQVDAMNLAKVATEAKNMRLNMLEKIMREELKKSEVDVGPDSKKLEYIGWGSKASFSPIKRPGQPRNLETMNHSAGTFFLDWKIPARGTGGLVRSYVIERRYKLQSSEFGPWVQVGIALETETMLIDQPRGLQLEYQVKAVNAGGESIPSNAVEIMLD